MVISEHKFHGRDGSMMQGGGKPDGSGRWGIIAIQVDKDLRGKNEERVRNIERLTGFGQVKE
jgi:hypothetical protein